MLWPSNLICIVLFRCLKASSPGSGVHQFMAICQALQLLAPQHCSIQVSHCLAKLCLYFFPNSSSEKSTKYIANLFRYSIMPNIKDNWASLRLPWDAGSVDCRSGAVSVSAWLDNTSCWSVAALSRYVSSFIDERATYDETLCCYNQYCCIWPCVQTLAWIITWPWVKLHNSAIVLVGRLNVFDAAEIYWRVHPIDGREAVVRVQNLFAEQQLHLQQYQRRTWFRPAAAAARAQLTWARHRRDEGAHQPRCTDW